MRILLIGAGNVGTYLGLNLHHGGHQVLQVFSRSNTRAKVLADVIEAGAVSKTDDLDFNVDVVILAVNDDSIADVFAAIRARSLEVIIVHTAGGIPIDVFDGHPAYGVIWPVQSMSDMQQSASPDIPLVINGSTEATISRIEKLALSISNKVYRMDETQRAFLHLAATFANNFSNHMYAIADQITAEHDISLDILKPIILETGKKILRMSPAEAQTGAAVRFDHGTLDRHLKLLADKPELCEIYRLLSLSIQKLKTQDDRC